ncbi:secretion protein [Paraburkholderia acidisoli]|uniref:Secretion protein n=1 Tax=Paraburkholderia acidisoli TaxID=2571748 RepID=A0A7Z2JJ44_9BURK|nr:secretion protein [Paraburkholderia acidisoli]QGZ65828.1 secretion protein [Paraburkholderia acidisoli]
MKLLRILTGHHAGAQVVLTPGTYRIGTDDDADIQLTDWRGADARLTMDESGAVCSERLEAEPLAPAADDAQGAEATASAAPPTLDPCKTWMIDFVPMQFDDTVLCIGWADAEWPSDLALLSTLLNAPVQAQREAEDAQRGAQRARRRRYAGIAAACVAVSVAAGGIAFALTTNVSRAALAPADVLLGQRLNRELAQAHLSELHAVPDGVANGDGAPRVIATGMVRSASEDYIARQLFERMKPGVVAPRYGIADETAHGISDALGMDGVKVSYDGNGVYTLSGAVADRPRVEAALARVRGDFGKRVKTIRVALTEVKPSAPATAKGTYIALVSSGDVQYAQTPDGVKHIYVAPDAASDAEAASAPVANAGQNTASAVASTSAETATSTSTNAMNDAAPATNAATNAAMNAATNAATNAAGAQAAPPPPPSQDAFVPLPH